MGKVQQLIEGLLPRATRRQIAAWFRRHTRRPRVGHAKLGDLRRLEPFSREWGFDRGTPVDRYYAEGFLARNSADIRGHVLEIGTDMYTRRYGGERVMRCEVLHVSEEHPDVTIVGDLTYSELFDAETFDCVILTATLQFIYDVRAALMTVHRALKPGGVLLCTVPGISPVSRYDMDRWGDYWRFTTRSLSRVLEETFPANDVTVEAHGNVLAAMAFLYGLASEELDRSELDHFDPDFEVLLAVRARKPGAAS